MDRDDLKTGMSFHKGFGIGFKETFFVFNEDGSVTRKPLTAIDGKWWGVPLLRGFAVLLFVFFAAYKVFGKWSAVFYAALAWPLIRQVWTHLYPGPVGATSVLDVVFVALFIVMFVCDAFLDFRVVKGVWRFITRLFTWHSMEHKVVTALLRNEKPSELMLRHMPKENPACGVTLFSYLVVLAVLYRSFVPATFLDVYIVLLLFPFAYEVHVWQRGKSWNIFTSFSWLLQFLFFTRQPKDSNYYKVGVNAMKVIYSEEKSGGKKNENKS